MIDHRDFVLNEIAKELDLLFSTFDTKILATAMMLRSAHALRAVHSAGMWKVDDVRAVIEGATKDVYEPLPKDQVPKVATLGGSGTLQ
jgi:hypothetical protein